jgi:hypothetical protein
MPTARTNAINGRRTRERPAKKPTVSEAAHGQRSRHGQRSAAERTAKKPTDSEAAKRTAKKPTVSEAANDQRSRGSADARE